MCCSRGWIMLSFFFQAEDGIRDSSVTGGALPIWIVWQEEPHCNTIRTDASRRGRGEEQARWHSSRWRLWLAAIPLGSRHCLRFQTSQAIGAYGLVGPSFSCVRSPHACVPGRQEPRPDHIGDEAQEGLVSEEGPVVGLPVWFHRYLSRSNGFPGGPIAHLVGWQTEIERRDLGKRACGAPPQGSHQGLRESGQAFLDEPGSLCQRGP